VVVTAAEGSSSGREGSEGSHGREASYSEREKLAETVRGVMPEIERSVGRVKNAHAALAVLAQPCQECDGLRSERAAAQKHAEVQAQHKDNYRERLVAAESELATLRERLAEALDYSASCQNNLLEKLAKAERERDAIRADFEDLDSYRGATAALRSSERKAAALEARLEQTREATRKWLWDQGLNDPDCNRILRKVGLLAAADARERDLFVGQSLVRHEDDCECGKCIGIPRYGPDARGGETA